MMGHYINDVVVKELNVSISLRLSDSVHCRLLFLSIGAIFQLYNMIGCLYYVVMFF